MFVSGLTLRQNLYVGKKLLLWLVIRLGAISGVYAVWFDIKKEISRWWDDDDHDDNNNDDDYYYYYDDDDDGDDDDDDSINDINDDDDDDRPVRTILIWGGCEQNERKKLKPRPLDH